MDARDAAVGLGDADEGRGSDSCLISPARVSASSAGITVGGVQRASYGRTQWWSGSVRGRCISLLAPAYGVRSDAMGGGTTVGWGTSQATAQTSGAAALVLGKHPSWTPAQVKSSLLSAASGYWVSGVPAGVPNRLLFTQGRGVVATSGTVTQIPNATGTSYVPTSADVGHLIFVRVQGTKTGWTSKAVLSPRTRAVQR